MVSPIRNSLRFNLFKARMSAAFTPYLAASFVRLSPDFTVWRKALSFVSSAVDFSSVFAVAILGSSL